VHRDIGFVYFVRIDLFDGRLISAGAGISAPAAVISSIRDDSRSADQAKRIRLAAYLSRDQQQR
jgi:hypothetical protein